MEVTKVSAESIEKALQTLGLKKAEGAEATTTVIQKSADEIAKEKLQTEIAETLKKAEDIKATIEGKKVEPVQIEKAEIVADIVKAMDEKFNALAVLSQSKDQVIQEQKESIDKQNTQMEELKKAVDETTKFINHLTTQVRTIGAQPLDRKSVTPGATYLEKGEEIGKLEKAGVRTLDINNKAQRKELVDMAFEKGYDTVTGKVKDNEFAKAVTPLELGSLGENRHETTRLQKRFLEEFKINVVRTEA